MPKPKQEELMPQERKMEDKRVLVTGAGTGIGRAVALEFARRGSAVVLHYSHSGQGAASAVEEITRAGGKAAAGSSSFRLSHRAERPE